MLKHAGPAVARVDVRYGHDAVEIDVADDGRGGLVGAGIGQRPARDRGARRRRRRRARGRPASRRRLRRPRAAALPGRRVIRVLIADDQSLVRTGFRLILSRRARHRGRRRGRDGAEATAARRRARARRRADGRAHARGRRDRGDPPDRRRRDEPAGARADDVRPRRHRLRRAPCRRERLPAQGRARGAPADRDPGRGRGRVALRAVGDPAADRGVRAARTDGARRPRWTS